MNFRLSILLALFIHFTGWGQNDTLNRIDAQGKKQGHWVFSAKDRPEKGFAPDGIIEEGTYVDDKKSGLWKKYYPDGKSVRLIGSYVNNRPFGKYAKYYLNGTLEEEGSFARNKYYGELKRYHANGQLAFHAKYNAEGKLIVPGIFNGKHTFELVENADKTTTFVQREVFKGILIPLMKKKLNTEIKSKFQLLNQKLKESVENKS